MNPTSAAGTDTGIIDAHLWDRVRTGDADALSPLYDRHAAAVYGFAFRRTASWSAAEDVLQTTFLRAWRTLTSGRPGSLRAPSARGWLLVVAGNECRNAARGARRLRQAVEVRSAPRSRVRRENLRHGATGVLVRNPRGDIYGRRRGGGCRKAAARLSQAGPSGRWRAPR